MTGEGSVSSYLYMSPPDVGDLEATYVLDALHSNWVAPVGPQLTAFEEEVAALVGVQHAVAVSSGTAALHLAMLALGVGAGDSVIVPSFTFAASANVVRYMGAEPVFIDSSRDTWTIDIDLVAEELAARAAAGALPKAVVSVDIYGQCADYDALRGLCDRYGVPVVEDAAAAMGSTYRGQPAGAFGDIAAVSFNGNKIMTSGGGGMLLTNDAAFAAQALHLATQAREDAPHYEHRMIGYNYRLSNLLAAVGRGQLAMLADKVGNRQRNRRYYAERFARVPGLELMPIADYGVPNCWLTCLLIDPARFGTNRDHIRKQLDAVGAESRPTWKPMHLQPVFAGCAMRGGEVCEDLFARGLCLPSGSALSESDLDRVASAVVACEVAG